MGSYIDTAAINVTNNTQVSTAGMAANSGMVSYSAGPLDGTALNATLNIFTTSNGLNFYPTHLVVAATATSGAFISAASISLGAGGSTINLLAATPLVGVNAAGLYLVIPLPLVATRVANGATITAKITTAVVGLTQLSLQVTVVGFYAA